LRNFLLYTAKIVFFGHTDSGVYYRGDPGGTFKKCLIVGTPGDLKNVLGAPEGQNWAMSLCINHSVLLQVLKL
jgi:hypothetical protein